jgi:nitrogen fixation/metabolism regulation signal transduction histidine kinase
MATRVPYGTMLAAAALVASLYGERLLAWYLGPDAGMNRPAFVLLSLTAVMAVLVAGLAFIVLRLFAAARQMNRGLEGTGTETAFMAAAMEEALGKLRKREQALAARAEASERLSDEIIASLTSGLLVVGADRHVRSLNPAGRRMLGMPDADWTGNVKDVLAGAPPLAGLIDECLNTGQSVRPPHGEVRHARRRHDASRGHRVAHRHRRRFAERRHLPVQRPHRHRGARGAAPAQGQSGAGRRADRRHRPRVPERAGDDPRLRAPARSRSPAADSRPYVLGIREETDTLGAVVRNFLNFAKPTELMLGRVDTRAVVERAAEDIRAEAISRGGAVEVRGVSTAGAGRRRAAAAGVRELFRNALEACTESGIRPHIVIESVPDRAQRIVRIAVIDNGPGVPRRWPRGSSCRS